MYESVKNVSAQICFCLFVGFRGIKMKMGAINGVFLGSLFLAVRKHIKLHAMSNSQAAIESKLKHIFLVTSLVYTGLFESLKNHNLSYVLA